MIRPCIKPVMPHLSDLSMLAACLHFKRRGDEPFLTVASNNLDINITKLTVTNIKLFVVQCFRPGESSDVTNIEQRTSAYVEATKIKLIRGRERARACGEGEEIQKHH